MARLPRSLVLFAGLTAAALAWPITGALAQVGGFTDGDLYLYSTQVTGPTSADGGLVHIDPLSGQTAELQHFVHSSLLTGAATFDPYRKRLLLWADLGGSNDQYGLWMLDAAGHAEQALSTIKQWGGLSPTGDGRVYLLNPYTGTQPFRWIDAANRQHDLLDETGTHPFSFSGIFNHPKSAMTYDAGTNALFVVHTGNVGAGCSGGSAVGLTLRKLPLSADGTRVDGPVLCTEFQVDAVQATETPVNWSRGPAGTLMLVCDNVNLTSAMPRVVLVDPVSFSVTTFAETGPYPGAALSTAGVYSSVLGGAVVLDTLGNVLRRFVLGESGAGTVITPTGPLSANLGSGEVAHLLEIDNGPCTGAFVPLGQGLAGSGGAVPALLASGCAALGSPMGLALRDVLGGSLGFLLVGVTPGQQPYRGGTLYMAAAELAVPLQAGGPAGVAGAGALDLSFGLLSDPALAGITLLLQAGFLDAAAPQGASLTQGLRVEFD